MCDDCNALLRVATSYVRRDTSNFKNLREKKIFTRGGKRI